MYIGTNNHMINSNWMNRLLASQSGIHVSVASWRRDFSLLDYIQGKFSV
jgi:hypothetical protein